MAENPYKSPNAFGHSHRMLMSASEKTLDIYYERCKIGAVTSLMLVILAAIFMGVGLVPRLSPVSSAAILVGLSCIAAAANLAAITVRAVTLIRHHRWGAVIEMAYHFALICLVIGGVWRVIQGD